MSKSANKQDRQNIAQAPLPIRKLYQVAMESRGEVLSRIKVLKRLATADVEQYIEEAM